ncbi:MAG: alpha/beta fold hydrolase [Anaerolineales bacterium]|nr:alpha/beta fold hydrolase [Anaerolineales bacterium]
MPTLLSNGITLYYETHGSGEPLVLINGLAYDLWMWHKMVPFLAEHFQVITFDNRGAGQSDAPKGPYSADMLADDLAGLLEGLGIPQAAIFGHSMGGFIAQAFALKYPEKVSKLILAATNFGGPRHAPITQEAMAVLMDISGDPAARLRRGIVVSCAPGFSEANADFVEEWINYRLAHPLNPESYQAQLAIGLSLLAEPASFEKKLSAVQAPTLILFGEHDKVVPPANAQLLAQALPHAQIEILPNAGHFFPFEIPEPAAKTVTQFLK